MFTKPLTSRQQENGTPQASAPGEEQLK